MLLSSRDIRVDLFCFLRYRAPKSMLHSLPTCSFSCWPCPPSLFCSTLRAIFELFPQYFDYAFLGPCLRPHVDPISSLHVRGAQQQQQQLRQRQLRRQKRAWTGGMGEEWARSSSWNQGTACLALKAFAVPTDFAVIPCAWLALFFSAAAVERGPLPVVAAAGEEGGWWGGWFQIFA